MRQLLAPVLWRQPDVTVANGWLVVLPVQHFLRGVWLQELSDGTSAPLWGIRNLWAYGVEPEIDGFMRTTFLDRQRTEQEISQRVCTEVEAVTLPFLRSVDSMSRLYALVLDQGIPDRTESLFYLELAMGHFDQARALKATYAASWFYFDDMFPDQDPADTARTRLLCRLLAEDDLDGIARSLHEWEADAARAFKVKRLWEPTPFPFEAVL